MLQCLLLLSIRMLFSPLRRSCSGGLGEQSRDPAKAQQARSLGFDEVIDLSCEKLSNALRRIRGGHCDRVHRPGNLERGAQHDVGRGTLITLGYSASRKSPIDVADLIWKRT